MKNKLYFKSISVVIFILWTFSAFSQNGWERMENMITARSVHASCVLNGKVFVTGGGNLNGLLGNVEIYDINENNWSTTENMLQVRIGHSVDALNDKIYAVGGIEHTQNPTTKNISEYDPIEGTWTGKGELPEMRWGHSSCVLNNKIILFGGLSINNDGMYSLKSTLSYDPVLNTIDTLADMNKARSFSGSCIYKDKIYVFGDQASASSEMYNPISDTWSEITDIPIPMFGQIVIPQEEKDRILVFGGSLSWIEPEVYNTIYQYEPDHDKWTMLNEMIFDYCTGTGHRISNYLFLFGGQHEGGNTSPVLLDVWRYTLDSLKQAPPLDVKKESIRESALLRNFPNPFSESTLLIYKLREPAYVSIEIYDVLGKKTASLVNEYQRSGDHEIDWNTKGMRSGVYYARFSTGMKQQTIKMIISE